MKKLVLLDLDNTLFDSSSFRKSLFEKIGNIYAKGKEAKNIAVICREIADDLVVEFGLLDPRIFLQRLGSRMGRRGEGAVLKLIFDVKYLATHVHKEVVAVLGKLAKFGEIGIFSQGDGRLQRAKLQSFKHLLHRGRIHITRDKKSHMRKVFQLYKGYKIFFVDDMLAMLYEAKKLDPKIVTVWMKRGSYAEKMKELPGFSPEVVVTELREVVKVVREAN